MANKKKKKRKSGKRIDWKYLCLFVIVQIVILVTMPLAIYSSWPSNERNTQTITGEIEQIQWRGNYGKHRDNYLVIIVDGEEYCVYRRSGRKELHNRDIEKALEPGDVVEISYKTGFHYFMPYNNVIGLKDQTQVYRTIEVYNANAAWTLPLLIALIIVAEIVFCAPFYITELLVWIVNPGEKKRKKKNQKERKDKKKPTP